MDSIWKDFLNEELQKQYMKDLQEFISERQKVVTVLPDRKAIFNAFNHCPFYDIKVIIIGQDPYPTKQDANGTAFSSFCTQTPLALRYIKQEILSDYFEGADWATGESGKTKVFKTNDLSEWGRQGVLLLNSCLTTEENTPGAHKDRGWELFIESTIKFLQSKNQSKFVWMLWGKQAQEFKKFIDSEKHLILEADHPTSAKSDSTKWFGNRHFTKANAFIKKNYFNLKPPINWALLGR